MEGQFLLKWKWSKQCVHYTRLSSYSMEIVAMLPSTPGTTNLESQNLVWISRAMQKRGSSSIEVQQSSPITFPTWLAREYAQSRYSKEIWQREIHTGIVSPAGLLGKHVGTQCEKQSSLLETYVETRTKSSLLSLYCLCEYTNIHNLLPCAKRYSLDEFLWSSLNQHAWRLGELSTNLTMTTCLRRWVTSLFKKSRSQAHSSTVWLSLTNRPWGFRNVPSSRISPHSDEYGFSCLYLLVLYMLYILHPPVQCLLY
jgi:hypothetical protein